jgi:hypothetical protein
VVWLGTGENKNQRSVSFGDGIYKSADAGVTWPASTGLRGTCAGRLRVEGRGGGRGGPPPAPLVAPGRYRATLGRQSGDTVTPIGSAQTFQVVALPR